MNIWFTKGFSNLFHAINDIKLNSSNFSVLCTHSNSNFLGFESADWFEKEPIFKNKEHFLNYCEKIIKKYNIKVIFPHHNQEWFNQEKDFFDNLNVKAVTVSGCGNVDLINNKNLFYGFISQINELNTPLFQEYSSYDDFKIAKKMVKFKEHKLCIKPSIGIYGSDFYKINSNSKFNVLKSLNRNNSMLLMQFLEGNERSCDCIAYNGKLIGAVIRLKNNNSNLPQIIEKNDEIYHQIEILTKTLVLNGMFNVQFKDSDHKPYVLEINPRLAGRSFYATIAGLNIPLIAAQIFSGIKSINDIEYNINYNARIGNISSGVLLNKTGQLSQPYNEIESYD